MASVECTRCWVTPGDLPYEELEMSLEEAADTLFEHVGDEVLCQGCAQLAGGGDRG